MVMPRGNAGFGNGRGFDQFLRMQESPIAIPTGPAMGATTAHPGGYTPSRAGTDIGIDPAVSQMTDSAAATSPIPAMTPTGGGSAGYSPAIVAQIAALLGGGGSGQASAPPPTGAGWQVDPYATEIETGGVPPGATWNAGNWTGGTGQGGNDLTPFGQSLLTDAIPYVMSDPQGFYGAYAPYAGVNENSGTYAMGMQNAASMPYEWMMTQMGNDPLATSGQRMGYYEGQIADGMNPGTEYYTTADFIGQAFQPGSRVNDYIFGPTIQGGQSVPKGHDQVMSDLFTVMEGVLAPTMAPDMLDNLMGMYAAAYRSYISAMTTDPTVANMSLEQWFESQGLGLSMLGG